MKDQNEKPIRKKLGLAGIRRILRSIEYILNLYLPNFKKIIKREFLPPKNYVAVQKVYVTGKGVAQVGEGISFGNKKGGYFRNGCIEIQARFENSKVVLRNNTLMNNNILFIASKLIDIGEDCLIGHDCEFIDFDGHGIHPMERRKSIGKSEPIVIGKNVWFGNNCKILKGTTIGDNCVIAGGSIVSGKFGNNLVIGGVPAKVIRVI